MFAFCGAGRSVPRHGGPGRHPVRLVGVVTDETHRERLDKPLREGWVDQGDFVRRGTLDVNRDRESAAIGDRYDLLMGRPRRLNLWEVADHEKQVDDPECEPRRRDGQKPDREEDQAWSQEQQDASEQPEAIASTGVPESARHRRSSRQARRRSNRRTRTRMKTSPYPSRSTWLENARRRPRRLRTSDTGRTAGT